MKTKSKKITTFTSLAALIAKRYQGRLRFEPNKYFTSRWYNGRSLHGAPLPPRANNGGHDPKAWLNWFERWIFPKWKLDGSQEDEALLQQRRQIETEAAIARARDTIRQSQIQEGRFKPVEVFNFHIRSFFSEINAYISEGERLMERILLADIGVSGLPEDKQVFMGQSVRKAVQAASDNLRNGLRQSLEKHTEMETPSK